MPGAGSAADQEGLEGLGLLRCLFAAHLLVLLQVRGVLIILGFLLHNLQKLNISFLTSFF